MVVRTVYLGLVTELELFSATEIDNHELPPTINVDIEAESKTITTTIENIVVTTEEETSVVGVVIEKLSDEEQNDRLYLERKVERAFYEAGRALRELRDKRLYRSTHKTFENYCQERFGFGRSRSHRLIDAANIVESLTDNSILLSNGQQILPTNERQVRPLTKLEPLTQRQAWFSAVESAGGKVPSGRIVFDIVQRIKEKIVLPNPYHVGEVCRIIGYKDYPELKGKGGQ